MATPEGETVGGRLRHLVVALGVALAVVTTFQVLVGFVWLAHILARTGRRERDLLWLLVPVANVWILAVSVWRYTADEPYWSPRPDRRSGVLGRRRALPVAVAGFVIFAATGVTARAEYLGAQHDGWLQSAPRHSLIERLIDEEGVAPDEASCVADWFEGRYASLGEYDALAPEQVRAAVAEAVEACS